MKQALKNILIPALAARPVSALAVRLFGRGLPIFMIHRMQAEGQPYTGTTPEHLRNCLQYLRDNGYTVISLEDLVLSKRNRTDLPDRVVVFTMDDGFMDQARIAAPLFLEFGYPLTFFVVSGLLDQQSWPWDAQVSWIIEKTRKKVLDLRLDDETVTVELGGPQHRRLARQRVRNILKELDAQNIPDLIQQFAGEAEVHFPDAIPPEYRPMDWATARDLESKGIRFGPHTRSHHILSKLDRDSSEREIVESWRTLQQELEDPLNIFCYPTGRVLDFGPREIDILKEQGFIGAVATEPGFVAPGRDETADVYRLPRIELPDNMTEFVQYCSWIEHARIGN